MADFKGLRDLIAGLSANVDALEAAKTGAETKALALDAAKKAKEEADTSQATADAATEESLKAVIAAAGELGVTV